MVMVSYARDWEYLVIPSRSQAANLARRPVASMSKSHSHHLNQVVELLRAALHGSAQDLFPEAEGHQQQHPTQGRWIETAKSDAPASTGASTGRWGGPVPDMGDCRDEELSSVSAGIFLDPRFPCGDQIGGKRLP